MSTGRTIFFDSARGFGFIAPDDGTADVFVHISAVENTDDIQQGRRVSFDVAPDRRTGRLQAANVHVLG